MGDQFVIWLNAVFAGSAVVVNLWAALHIANSPLKRLFTAIASLAFLYMLAYVWLGFHQTRSGEWSDFVRPLGMITWVLAWSIEPVLLVRYFRSTAKGMVLDAERRAGVS